jgi:D-sedoheptulose 7-phosphate isomerase
MSNTGFLYPFLQAGEGDARPLLADLAASARAKAGESARLQRDTIAEWADQVSACGAAMARRFAAGGRMYAFGNGGSATDCATLVTLFSRPPAGRPLAALNLTADQAVVTALGNDVGFDLVFSRQIIAHTSCTPGGSGGPPPRGSTPGGSGGSPPRGSTDIAVAFSTSGSSRDLMAALREARDRGLLTIGFAGYAGGEMAAAGAVDYCFVVRSQSVHRIQESQALLGYHLWAAVMRELTGEHS